MAVVITKEIRKKRMLIAAFAVLVLAAFAILYFGGVIGGGRQIQTAGPDQNISSGPAEQVKVPISDAKLKILEDERFKILQNPPGVPVKTDTTGKVNPFSD